MLNDLTLRIEGSDASQLSDALQILFTRELEQSVRVKKQDTKKPSQNDKSLETVLAISSFILSVPGFFLAMQTLMDRLGNKDKLDKLAMQSAKLIAGHNAIIWIQIDNQSYKFEPQNTAVIHEALVKQAALQEKKAGDE